MTAPRSLIERLKNDETILTSWIGIPEPLMAELTARAGYDAVTLDMQHGLLDPVAVMRGVTAVRHVGIPPIVRVPVDDFAMASRALDFGAEAVIAPMINSVDDARRFADAMKYPPIGKRSWGPTRAMQLTGVYDGNTFLKAANANTLAFAMIETPAALAALDEILALDGIDGVFVGPSDLSLTLAQGAKVDPMSPENERTIAEIGRRTRAAGKFAATFAIKPETCAVYRAFGYQIIANGSDTSIIAAGSATLLNTARALIAKA